MAPKCRQDGPTLREALLEVDAFDMKGNPGEHEIKQLLDQRVVVIAQVEGIAHLAHLRIYPRILGELLTELATVDRALTCARQKLNETSIDDVVIDTIHFDLAAGDGADSISRDNLDLEDMFDDMCLEVPKLMLQAQEHRFEALIPLHHERLVEAHAPQPVNYTVQVPRHEATMVEKEIPKIIHYTHANMVVVPHLNEIERLASHENEQIIAIFLKAVQVLRDGAMMVEESIPEVTPHARVGVNEVPHLAREKLLVPEPWDPAGMGKSLSTPHLETCDDHRACLRAAAFSAHRRYGT